MSKILYNIKLFIIRARIFAFLTLLLQSIIFAGKGYDLDEYDDLELESLNKIKKNTTNNSNNQKLILFDDNLYLLDDDFDFGEDELEIHKLELNNDDMEMAREYEDFLNAFFENSTPIGFNANASEKSRFSNQKTSRKPKAKRSARSTSAKKGSTNTPPPSFRPTKGALGFGISTIIGATIPVTMAGYSIGTNFGIRIDTPISFNVAGMEASLGTDLYLSSMTASEGDNNFKITNIVGSVSLFPFSSIEIRAGLGFTPLAIGTDSDAGVSLPVDINYYLPINLSGFKFALNMHAQRTLAYPAGQDGDATDFIYMGLLINTPLAF